MPTPGPDVVPERLAMDLASGYVQRGADEQPRSGNREPWLVSASYTHDKQSLQDGALDQEMVFSRAAAAVPAMAEAAE